MYIKFKNIDGTFGYSKEENKEFLKSEGITSFSNIPAKDFDRIYKKHLHIQE